MVGGLTAKADAHYKRDVSSILPIPESPQGVQALDDGGSVAGRQRESWLFFACYHATDSRRSCVPMIAGVVVVCVHGNATLNDGRLCREPCSDCDRSRS